MEFLIPNGGDMNRTNCLDKLFLVSEILVCQCFDLFCKMRIGQNLLKKLEPKIARIMLVAIKLMYYGCCRKEYQIQQGLFSAYKTMVLQHQSNRCFWCNAGHDKIASLKRNRKSFNWIGIIKQSCMIIQHHKFSQSGYIQELQQKDKTLPHTRKEWTM